MRRRKLAATAVGVSVTAFAATLAIGANLGLVGHADPTSPVGHLDDRHPVVTVAPADPATTVAVTPAGLGPHADD